MPRKSKKHPRPTVTYKKLGQSKAVGFAYTDKNPPLIELDERLYGRRHLEVLCHETAHCFFPDLPEKTVEEFGYYMRDVLWKEGYRQIIE